MGSTHIALLLTASACLLVVLCIIDGVSSQNSVSSQPQYRMKKLVTLLNGDGKPKLLSGFNSVQSMRFSPQSGELYVSEGSSIRKFGVDQQDSFVSTFAGVRASGAFNGENVNKDQAQFYAQALVFSKDGSELYFVDNNNYRIRKIKDNKVTTIAGDGKSAQNQYEGNATNLSI